MEVKADLEAQGVAGAEPAGDDAGVEQLGPDRRRAAGIEQQLDPVLAGVAGAADRAPGAPPIAAGATCIRGGSSRPQGAGDDPARVRALHGEHRVAVGDVAQRRSRSRATQRAIQRRSLGVVGGVGDGQVAVAARAGR